MSKQFYHPPLKFQEPVSQQCYLISVLLFAQKNSNKKYLSSKTTNNRPLFTKYTFSLGLMSSLRVRSTGRAFLGLFPADRRPFSKRSSARQLKGALTTQKKFHITNLKTHYSNLISRDPIPIPIFHLTSFIRQQRPIQPQTFHPPTPVAKPHNQRRKSLSEQHSGGSS